LGYLEPVHGGGTPPKSGRESRPWTGRNPL